MSEEQENYRTVAEYAFIRRLQEEEKEVGERFEKLRDFISTEKFQSIEHDQAALLVIQASAMLTYHQILVARLNLLR